MTNWLIYRKGSNSYNQSMTFDWVPIAIVMAETRAKAAEVKWSGKPTLYGAPTLAAEIVAEGNGGIAVYSNQVIRAVPESRARRADWNAILEEDALAREFKRNPRSKFASSKNPSEDESQIVPGYWLDADYDIDSIAWASVALWHGKPWEEGSKILFQRQDERAEEAFPVWPMREEQMDIVEKHPTILVEDASIENVQFGGDLWEILLPKIQETIVEMLDEAEQDRDNKVTEEADSQAQTTLPDLRLTQPRIATGGIKDPTSSDVWYLVRDTRYKEESDQWLRAIDIGGYGQDLGFLDILAKCKVIWPRIAWGTPEEVESDIMRALDRHAEENEIEINRGHT